MSDERQDLERAREERDRAYSQLAEVTSRLLSVNEAADRFVSSHHAEDIAVALLQVSAQAVGARQGAVFLSQGDGSFHLLAQLGFEGTTVLGLANSLPDMAILQLVENEKRTFDAAEARKDDSFAEWAAEARAENPKAEVEPMLDLFLPLALEGHVAGVLALGRRAAGGAYAEDDRLFLEHMLTQGALALDRALLFVQNQNRLRDLDALLKISRELTSTLDMDAVLLTAVNTTSAIVERQRAVLALYQGDRLVIRAVSDFPRVDASTAEKLGLVRLLEWLALKKPAVLTADATRVQSDESFEGREVLMEYFRAGDMRSLHVVGLKDDLGPVGVLLLESYREGAFASEADRDTLAVLAGQLATAIRNAELFRQLPMAGALAPLAERRRRWQRLTRAQRMRWIVGSVVVALAIAAVPWPRGVAGEAQVLPATEVPVRAETGGILKEVLVGSGKHVSAGEVVARLDAVDAGSRMAELRAEADMARNRYAQAEAARDPLERRQAELGQQESLARLQAAESEGASTQLTAPADGYVLTPALEEQLGSYLNPGQVLCYVSPLDTLRVEVAVSELDMGSVRPGERLRLKVLGFPDRQFKGRVTEVSWQGEPGAPGKPSTFLVRGWVANEGMGLRAGMTGRARVDVGGATLLSRWVRGPYRALRFGLWL
jgi:RND family efflux transporter MFP subunit